MSLSIRLSRSGAKKHPFYRIVLADVRAPRDGRFIERLGSYNPLLSKDHIAYLSLKKERIQYWLNVGARPTNRVARFLGEAGLIHLFKIPNQTKKHRPKTKAQERAQNTNKNQDIAINPGYRNQ